MHRARHRTVITASLIAAIAVAAIAVRTPDVRAAAPSPEVGVVVSVVSDGSAPFDVAPGAGLDLGAANGIVRALDMIRYHVDFQFNHVSAVPRQIVLHSSGGGFTAVPGACRTGTISPDATTLTCEIATTPTAGSSGGFDVAVQVGAVADGSIVSLSATASAAGATATDAADDITVTAAPRWDLSALTGGDVLAPPVRGAGGASQSGVVVSIPITVEADLAVNDGRGTEGLALADLHFSIDVTTTQLDGTPLAAQPAWRLLDFTDPLLSVLEPCSPTRFLSQVRPYGTVTDAASAANSVTDSGTWTCTQAAPGAPIDVTVSGAALDTSHFPDYAGVAFPLSPRKLVLSGQVAVFVDLAYVESVLPPPDGGEFKVAWTVSGFDPMSASGVSNYGAATEPVFNNSDAATITHYYCCGGWDSMYTNSYQDMELDHPIYGPGIYADWRPTILAPNHFTFIPTQTQTDHAGDGTVVAGDRFALLMGRSGASDTPSFNSVMCAMIDPTQTVLADSAPIVRSTVDSTPGPNFGHTISTTLVPVAGPVIAQSTSSFLGYGDPTAPFDDSFPFVVEYGTGSWSASNSSCNDADSPTGWTTDPSTTAGAGGGEYPAVTKVRVRGLAELAPSMGMRAFVSLRVVSTAPAGTYLWSHATYGDWAAGAAWSGAADEWNATGYDPITHANVHFGDRVRLADRTMVVLKSTDSSGLKVVGDTVDFTLSATLNGSPSSFVRLVDTLPDGVSLVSADPAPTAVNGQELTWEWGTTPGSTTREVHYTVRIDADAPTGADLVNQVTGTADGLDQNGDVLSSYAVVRTASTFQQLDVWKSTSDDVVEVTDPVHFTLHAANTSNAELANVDLIDVLPWNGDGRVNASTIHGSWVLQPIVADPADTLAVTAAAPMSIDDDAAAATNQPGGSTVWCAPADLGTSGCPQDWSHVTAIRVQRAALAAGDQLSIDVVLSPAGDAAGDRFANSWTGRFEGAPFAARSEDVEVPVVASSLRALVRCDSTGGAVAGVGVTVAETNASGVTDANGELAVAGLHSGAYTVTFDLSSLPGWNVTGEITQVVQLGVDDEATVSVSACPPTPVTTSSTTSTTSTTILDVVTPTTRVPPRQNLPTTGSDPRSATMIAMTLALGGVALVVVGRRRRRLSEA